MEPSFEIPTETETTQTVAEMFETVTESFNAVEQDEQARAALEASLRAMLDYPVEQWRQVLSWYVPATAPASPSDCAYWLHRQEAMALISMFASKHEVPELEAHVEVIEQCLAEKEAIVKGLPTGWWHARTAKQRTEQLGQAIRPWVWIAPATQTGVFDSASEPTQQRLIQAWALGALLDEDAASLKRLVQDNSSSWHRVYAQWCQKQLKECEIVLQNLDLEIGNNVLVHRFAFPHLGDSGLSVEQKTDGLHWKWSTSELLTESKDGTVTLPLGPETGELSCRLFVRQVTELESARRSLFTLRKCMSGVLDDEQALKMGQQVWSWYLDRQDWMKKASDAFESDTDPGPALLWVQCFVKGRALLETLCLTLEAPEAQGDGAKPLRERLSDGDRLLSRYSNAVQMLPEDDRLELWSEEAPAGAWWSCADASTLDDSWVRETLVQAPPSPPASKQDFLPQWLRSFWTQVQDELRTIVQPVRTVPLAAAAGAASVSDKAFYHWESDNGWQAMMEVKATSGSLYFSQLPPTATEVFLGGLTLSLQREGEETFCSVDFEKLNQSMTDSKLSLDLLVVRCGDDVQIGKLVP